MVSTFWTAISLYRAGANVTRGVWVRKTQGVDKETIQETIRREGVDVDESGKTARREKGTGKESL
jgi:stress response protein YsnF